MARVFVRHPRNHKWLDFCKHTVLVRSGDNRRWTRVDPRKLNFRDGADSEFIPVDCAFDERFDDPCPFRNVNSVNCPPGMPVEIVGSGDGTGSNGRPFDLLDGYPPGYDLPDASESGFQLERATNFKKGVALKRPALNYALESYDDSGVTPSYGRGTYANPNYLGSSVFGDGMQITETVFDVGIVPGYFEIPFASYDEIGISIDAYFMGVRVATTCGYVRGRSKIEFYLDPIIGEGETRVMLRVRCEDGNRWTYMLNGPKAALPVYNLDNTDIVQFQQLYTPEYSGTPVFPAPCHATVFPNEARLADGKWFYEFHHYIGDVADDVDWDLVLDYTSWFNADKFEVYHGAERIASTMDPRQDLGMLKFRWNPKRYVTPVPDIMVRVTSVDRIQFDDLKSWYYTLFCPNVDGYRRRPWRCGTPMQGINSMGHNSTEDNFDMDNGIDPGVASVKVVGYGEFDMTVTIFDAGMQVIEVKSGRGVVLVPFIINTALHGNTRKNITVRIDAPIGSSWTYHVACPIPMLDVILNDKIVPVCAGALELAINDIGVTRGQIARFTVMSNVPSASDTTLHYATQDATATSTGIPYTGLPAVYGVENETLNAATFAVHKLVAGMVCIDASWYRLANNDLRNGINSNLNSNAVTSTYVNLSPDAKMLINAWRKRITNINGRRWLILTSSANNWAQQCSNVVESLNRIYGIVPTIVLDDYSTVDPTTFDIVTLADCGAWTRRDPAGGKDYITQAYVDKYYSNFVSSINTLLTQGKIVHGVLKQDPSLTEMQYANGLIRELLNRNSQVEIDFNPGQVQDRVTAQYYIANHVISYPDSPLVENINSEALWDADFKQVMLTYKKPIASLPADFDAETGTVVIPAGQTSVSIEVETRSHNVDNSGKFFFVNLTSTSAGDIVRAAGKAIFIAGSGGGTTDFNFTKSNFSGVSYNTFEGNVKASGAAVILGIGYSQVADGRGQLGLQNGGTVAFAEVHYGQEGDSRARTVNGKCGEYPYDPALTYQYKWEVYEVFNNINTDVTSSVLIAATDYSAANDLVKVSIASGHAVDPVNTLRSGWTAFAYIKDSKGKIYRSQELSINLLSNSASYG